jgi:hypothetical protein
MSADELSMANWRPTQELQKRKSKSCCGFVAVVTFQSSQGRDRVSSCSAGKEKGSRFVSSIHPDRSRKEQSSSSRRGCASVMTMAREEKLDLVLVPLGLAALAGYHLWLLYTIRRHPTRTVIGVNAMARNRWVSAMMGVSTIICLPISLISTPLLRLIN